MRRFILLFHSNEQILFRITWFEYITSWCLNKHHLFDSLIPTRINFRTFFLITTNIIIILLCVGSFLVSFICSHEDFIFTKSSCSCRNLKWTYFLLVFSSHQNASGGSSLFSQQTFLKSSLFDDHPIKREREEMIIWWLEDVILVPIISRNRNLMPTYPIVSSSYSLWWSDVIPSRD